jgi:hypothetical protein
MKKMNRHLKYILVLLTIISIKSCDYLEAEEYLHEVDSANDLWTTRLDIRSAWAACFTNIPKYHSFSENWAFATADDGFPGRDEYAGLFLKKSNFSSENIPNKLNFWGHFYRGIRVCNLFIENSVKADSSYFTKGELESYQLDAKFMRAFYHANLFELYGPFVIVNKTVDYSTSEYPTIRSTVDDCVNFLIDEFDELIQKLPAKGDLLKIDLGRPTKGAAMACKARVLLYAASPLLNGNSMYSNFKNSKGEDLIPQTLDSKKWELAAKAYKDIIDLGTYSLHTVVADSSTVKLGDFSGNSVTWPNGPAGIDPYKSFKSLFDGTDKFWNDETIWQIPTNSYELVISGWPRMHKSSNSARTFHTNVTQKLVDAFYMNNGKTPKEEDGKLYDDNGFTTVGDSLYIIGTHNYDNLQISSPVRTNFLASNSIPKPPKRVLKREARFYATIGFIGRGQIQNDENNPYYYPNYQANNLDGYFETDRPSLKTGYAMYKWIGDEETSPNVIAKKSFHVYRMAEVYLSYAEALNEYDPGNANIIKYFNLVRFRAGLPGITETDQAKVRELIKKERMIEFAFESKRYFDGKRWLDASKINTDEWGNSKGFGGKIFGCNYKEAGSLFYNRFVIDLGSFRDKDYLFPIPYSNVNNYWGPTVQNPGW